MFKKHALAFCACLFSLAINAQDNEVTRILEEVAQNNLELKAFASLMEGRQLELRAGNNLKNPEMGAYFLPFGDHSRGDYREFQITQSFEFPSVYAARKNLINEQTKDLDLAYLAKKQEVLLSAKRNCIELIILNKTLAIEEIRLEQAKKVLAQIKTLFEKGQVGILMFNRAKIVTLQQQFNLQKIDLQNQSLLNRLKNINGGIEVSIVAKKFLDNYTLSDFDDLWQEKLKKDPYLISLRQKAVVALQNVSLNKSKALPNITAGFNHQGVSGDYYSGVYAGVSIPLFDAKNKVKAAEANYQFQQSYSDFLFIKEKAAFEKQYNEYALLKEQYSEFNQTLGGLNSEMLLLESYELGEVSFMEYYVELQFYQQAAKAILDMENQLNLSKAELLKHQL